MDTHAHKHSRATHICSFPRWENIEKLWYRWLHKVKLCMWVYKTHTNTMKYTYTHKLGHTNACWQLALATRGEGEKTRMVNKEWMKWGRRDEKKPRGERKEQLKGQTTYWTKSEMGESWGDNRVDERQKVWNYTGIKLNNCCSELLQPTDTPSPVKIPFWTCSLLTSM